MDNFDQIKKYLLEKQKEVINKLQALDENETSLNEPPEALEAATYAWEAEIGSTKAAMRRELSTFANEIKNTIAKLQKGTYGLCEKCQKQIEKERLKVMPTASYCLTCL